MPPTDEPNYEIAHLVARLAGEEGHDHPRQKAARWLCGNGSPAELAEFNCRYARATDFARRLSPWGTVISAARVVIGPVRTDALIRHHPA